MRPAARWVSVAAVLCASAAPGLAATPAWADSLTTQVDSASWYWAEQSAVGPAPVGAPRDASGVPAGDLGVAYTTDVDKMTALSFAVDGVPDGATFTSFTVTMPLDPAAQQLANGTPQIVACPALDPVPDGKDPGALPETPTQNSVGCADGKYDGKGAWVFDLSAIAVDWAGQSANGVVVRPKPGDATPFNYAFLGKKDIKVAAEFSLPTAPVAEPAPAPPADAGAGVAQPPTGFDSGSANVGAPALAPVNPPVAAPQPQVMPPAAPVVAAPAAAPAAQVTVDALRPQASFWLALLGIVVLLVLTGLVLGDPMAPVAFDARRRRFADIVRARAAARSAAAAQPTPTAPPRARPA